MATKELLNHHLLIRHRSESYKPLFYREVGQPPEGVRRIPETDPTGESVDALSSDEVDLSSLLPDAWITAHPEHILEYRRDEAEAAASARRRRRAIRRPKTRESALSP